MLTNYTSIEQLQVMTTGLILLTSFIFLMQNRIYSMINTFAWQSGLLVFATILEAIAINHWELILSASITLLLKVFLIPYLLRYLVRKLNIRHKVALISHPFLLLLAAIVLVLFCYHLLVPNNYVAWFNQNNIIAVAMSVTLLGMLLLITHRKAISHVIGFMSMENGIFFAALIATHGMPMAVELGIAFDVLVVCVLFGVFFFHLRSSIDSLDVDQLNLLREDVE
jgi:hydrogenase-4 component E